MPRRVRGSVSADRDSAAAECIQRAERQRRRRHQGANSVAKARAALSGHEEDAARAYAACFVAGPAGTEKLHKTVAKNVSYISPGGQVEGLEMMIHLWTVWWDEMGSDCCKVVSTTCTAPMQAEVVFEGSDGLRITDIVALGASGFIVTIRRRVVNPGTGGKGNQIVRRLEGQVDSLLKELNDNTSQADARLDRLVKLCKAGPAALKAVASSDGPPGAESESARRAAAEEKVQALTAEITALREAQQRKERIWHELTRKKDAQLTHTLTRERAGISKLRQHIHELQEQIAMAQAQSEEFHKEQQRAHQAKVNDMLHRLIADPRLARLQKEQRMLLSDFAGEIRVCVETHSSTITERVVVEREQQQQRMRRRSHDEPLSPADGTGRGSHPARGVKRPYREPAAVGAPELVSPAGESPTPMTEPILSRLSEEPTPTEESNGLPAAAEPEPAKPLPETRAWKPVLPRNPRKSEPRPAPVDVVDDETQTDPLQDATTQTDPPADQPAADPELAPAPAPTSASAPAPAPAPAVEAQAAPDAVATTKSPSPPPAASAREEAARLKRRLADALATRAAAEAQEVLVQEVAKSRYVQQAAAARLGLQVPVAAPAAGGGLHSRLSQLRLGGTSPRPAVPNLQPLGSMSTVLIGGAMHSGLMASGSFRGGVSPTSVRAPSNPAQPRLFPAAQPSAASRRASPCPTQQQRSPSAVQAVEATPAPAQPPAHPPASSSQQPAPALPPPADGEDLAARLAAAVASRASVAPPPHAATAEPARAVPADAPASGPTAPTGAGATGSSTPAVTPLQPSVEPFPGTRRATAVTSSDEPALRAPQQGGRSPSAVTASTAAPARFAAPVPLDEAEVVRARSLDTVEPEFTPISDMLQIQVAPLWIDAAVAASEAASAAAAVTSSAAPDPTADDLALLREQVRAAELAAEEAERRRLAAVESARRAERPERPAQPPPQESPPRPPSPRRIRKLVQKELSSVLHRTVQDAEMEMPLRQLGLRQRTAAEVTRWCSELLGGEGCPGPAELQVKGMTGALLAARLTAVLHNEAAPPAAADETAPRGHQSLVSALSWRSAPAPARSPDNAVRKNQAPGGWFGVGDLSRRVESLEAALAGVRADLAAATDREAEALQQLRLLQQRQQQQPDVPAQAATFSDAVRRLLDDLRALPAPAEQPPWRRRSEERSVLEKLGALALASAEGEQTEDGERRMRAVDHILAVTEHALSALERAIAAVAVADCAVQCDMQPPPPPPSAPVRDPPSGPPSGPRSVAASTPAADEAAPADPPRSGRRERSRTHPQEPQMVERQRRLSLRKPQRRVYRKVKKEPLLPTLFPFRSEHGVPRLEEDYSPPISPPSSPQGSWDGGRSLPPLVPHPPVEVPVARRLRKGAAGQPPWPQEAGSKRSPRSPPARPGAGSWVPKWDSANSRPFASASAQQADP
eukprot:TRINITY_DN20182_c0_g1_i1.p1 TRINITY_DN20182_c0_g1~~TRINITY_DN20182_c0_g1_i1.p1  ORF type:complete len:1437 (+),score=366.64 TRINITY_DN20182_c0_g1_i1:105-4415(+)